MTVTKLVKLKEVTVYRVYTAYISYIDKLSSDNGLRVYGILANTSTYYLLRTVDDTHELQCTKIYYQAK